MKTLNKLSNLNKHKNITPLILFVLIIGLPFSIEFNRTTVIHIQPAVVSAQANTGTDANTTTKSSATRDGTSKATGTFPGFVKGLVFDNETNKLVSRASVGLRQASKLVGTLNTNDEGSYFFQVLPGNYNIEVDKKGFSTGTGKATVSAFETTTKNINLKLSINGNGNETPTPRPKSTLKPEQTPVLQPASTPDPEPEVTQTPVKNNDIIEMNIEPAKARRSIRWHDAVVTILDHNGNPVPNVIVNASSQGRRSKVKPDSVTTDSEGKAAFRYRIGLLSRRAEIIFTAEELSDTLKIR